MSDIGLPENREPRAIFCTGWKRLPLWLRFGTSLWKYVLRKRKYPLFSLKALTLLRNRELFPSGKCVKFAGRYYTGILGVPHWPSPPFDHMAGKGGLNFSDSGTPLKTHIDSVMLAVTRKCRYNCRHCYEYENLTEHESVPVSRWKDVVRELQEIGVSIIVFSGGEPMLRFEDLIELLASGDKTRSDFHVHSAGHGVTYERAAALKKAGLDSAAVGIDDFDPETHDRLRGKNGAFAEAVAALHHFRRAGIFTYVNVCLRKELVSHGYLWKFYRAMKELQVGAILLLEPKPCGQYFHTEVGAIFSDSDREIVTEFFLSANRDRKYKDYPLVSYMAYFEDPRRFGCNMGGLSHLYINSVGDVQPCIFLPVSFGSIMNESFTTIYRRMREAVPRPLHKQCPSLYLRSIIEKKHSQGIKVPVPFSHIEEEWTQMFA